MLQFIKNLRKSVILGFRKPYLFVFLFIFTFLTLFAAPSSGGGSVIIVGDVCELLIFNSSDNEFNISSAGESGNIEAIRITDKYNQLVFFGEYNSISCDLNVENFTVDTYNITIYTTNCIENGLLIVNP